MAATFLAALIEAYAGSGLPTLHFDEFPEGGAENLPNAVLEHDGEIPEYQAKDLIPAYEIGKATFRIFHDDLDALERIATSLKNRFKTNALAIDGRDVRLERKQYRLSAVKGYRTAEGKPVYEAMIAYSAEIDEA